MKVFQEMYLVLYRYDHRWKIKMYRASNAKEAETKFRNSKIFSHMVNNDGDRYMVFVFTGVEDYV